MAKTVASTSLNQVAAGLKKAVQYGYAVSGMKAIDYGGGRFTKGIEFLAEHGIEAKIIDPFTQTEDANSAAIDWVYEHHFIDVVFLNNVLNVIPCRSDRTAAIIAAWHLLRKGGCLIVTIYEGDKGGSVTGFQNNLASSCYLGEILEILPRADFRKRGQMYVFYKM
jgi:hypothetical protein